MWWILIICTRSWWRSCSSTSRVSRSPSTTSSTRSWPSTWARWPIDGTIRDLYFNFWPIRTLSTSGTRSLSLTSDLRIRVSRGNGVNFSSPPRFAVVLLWMAEMHGTFFVEKNFKLNIYKIGKVSLLSLLILLKLQLKASAQRAVVFTWDTRLLSKGCLLNEDIN